MKTSKQRAQLRIMKGLLSLCSQTNLIGFLFYRQIYQQIIHVLSNWYYCQVWNVLLWLFECALYCVWIDANARNSMKSFYTLISMKRITCVFEYDWTRNVESHATLRTIFVELCGAIECQWSLMTHQRYDRMVYFVRFYNHKQPEQIESGFGVANRIAGARVQNRM